MTLHDTNSEALFTRQQETKTSASEGRNGRHMAELMGLDSVDEIDKDKMICMELRPLTSEEIALRLTPVSEETRDKSTEIDADVRKNYSDAEKTLTKLTSRVQELQGITTEKMAIARERLEAEISAQQDTILRKRNLNLAIVESQYQQELLRLSTDGKIASLDIDDVINTNNERAESQNFVISVLNQEINGGMARQKTNELHRHAAIETIDSGIVQYHLLETDLIAADVNRNELLERLNADEVALNNIVVEENKLNAEKQRGVKALTEDYINEMRITYASETSESAAIKKTIQDFIKQIGDSDEFEEITQNIRMQGIRLKKTQKNIDNINILIQAVDRIIAEAEVKQAEVLARIESAKTVADEQRAVHSPVRYEHSSEVFNVTEVQSSLAEGSITQVAKKPIPEILKDAYKKEIDFKRAVKNLIEQPQLSQREIGEIEIDRNLSSIFSESQSVEDSIISEQKRQETLEKHATLTESFISFNAEALIKKMFKRGAKLGYNAINKNNEVES